MSIFELSLLIPVVIIGIITQLCIWVYAIFQLVREAVRRITKTTPFSQAL